MNSVPNTLHAIIPDFRGVANIDDIKTRFYSAAKAIMLDYCLVYGETHLQITALELYLRLSQHPDVWCDPSTHGKKKDHEHLQRGTWYVHHHRAPKRLGIDITAGSVSEEIYAGLLIAAVDGADGSGSAVNAIMRPTDPYGYSSKELEIFLGFNRTRIDEGVLRLVERRSEPRKARFWIGRRKGLGSKVPPDFKEAPLRIAVDPPCGEWKLSNSKLAMSPI
jgi:hypothetical protein